MGKAAPKGTQKELEGAGSSPSVEPASPVGLTDARTGPTQWGAGGSKKGGRGAIRNGGLLPAPSASSLLTQERDLG